MGRPAHKSASPPLFMVMVGENVPQEHLNPPKDKANKPTLGAELTCTHFSAGPRVQSQADAEFFM